MKGSTIAIGAIGVFNLGMVVLRYAANRHARNRAAEKAIADRAEDVAKAVADAQKNCDIFKACGAREKKEFELQQKDWKLAHDFDSRKQDILDGAAEGLREYKSQLGYSEKLEALDDAFESSVEAFKNSIDYDGMKAKLEKEIAEAKAHFESQKALFDASSNDISDTAMKLRHAEEEIMTSKVKAANEKLEGLETQLKEEIEKLTKKKQSDIRELEEKISKEKIRLSKKSDKDLEKLNDELSKAQDDIRKKIRKGRTEEEKAAFMNHDDDIRLLREQKELDEMAATKIFDETPMDIRFARFLKEKKIPKFVAVAVAIIPMIPVGYLVYRYGYFVFGVIRNM